VGAVFQGILESFHTRVIRAGDCLLRHRRAAGVRTGSSQLEKGNHSRDDDPRKQPAEVLAGISVRKGCKEIESNGVGLTPEMLPMVLSANLAKGAVKLSKHKVIAKRLSSIQTLGAMDILCTDKTGTITEDRVVLVQHLAPSGKKSDRVLEHAYLNSFFQTGLKNLLDAAIIEKAQEKSLGTLSSRYFKLDEIPFDFVRRTVLLHNCNISLEALRRV
jgi:hypothetical protein